MSFELPIAVGKLKNTERLVHQGMWLLLLIAGALMLMVRRSAPGSSGAFWILGCAVLVFMLSFALRDAVRKLMHRYTEDKIVKDVKTFLEREPAPPMQPAISRVVVSRPEEPVNDTPLLTAGFISLKEGASFGAQPGDPVVFDTFPARESVAVKMDFYAVLLPVLA